MPRASDKDGPSKLSKLIYKIFSKLKKIFSSIVVPKAAPVETKNTVSELATEGEIINNMGSFSDKTLEDIMIPRSDIVSIDLNSSLEELNSLILKYAHTRILVHKEHLDNIVGFVNIKDLFQVIIQSKKFNLKKLIRKHIVTPHSMKLIDLLAQMQRSRTHIAIVVDEYGGTDGLVTIEDIIEEIVGDIDDEHDIGDDEGYKIIRPGLVITNARVEISELESILGISLGSEDDEFDTIGGLIMAKSGSVPEKGEIINIAEDIVAEILDSTPRTIKQVKITYSNLG